MRETKFIKTEIGDISSSWSVKILRDITSLITDGAHFSPKEANVGYYMPSVKDMTTNGFDFSCCKRISREDYIFLKKQGCEPQKGDVLIAKDGSMLKYAFCYDPVKSIVILSSIAIIRPNESVDSQYLALFFSKPEVVDYVVSNYKTGTGVPRIVLANFAKLPVALPPLDEQHRIAKALGDMGGLISSLDELIKKKRDIKKGAMQLLLTGKKRLEGFTKPWDEIEIGNLGRTYCGLTGKSAKDFGHGSAKYITFLNVLNNPKIDTSIFEKVEVNEGESQNAVRKGDLLFNTSSETPDEVGICSAMLEDIDGVYLNSFCFGFRPNENVDPLFMSYWFRSSEGRNLMITLAQGSTRYNLSKDNMMKSIIRIPLKDEQMAIANILNEMDAEISSLEQKRAKYEAIKKGMMQELLTGKIRLI